MSIRFITLPDDAESTLQSLANATHRAMRGRGYRVTVEPRDLELPGTPTLGGKRRHEVHFILVRQQTLKKEVEAWVRYAQSCSGDTRITFVCASSKRLGAQKIAELRKLGVGIAIPMDGGIQFLTESRDIAFHAQAPRRESLKPRVRSLLGDALDKLENGDWRDAFEGACTTLEEECRRHLLKYHRLNRVRYKQGNVIKTPTIAQIRKMPLGRLKDIYCNLISQNQLDANLCTALTRLNPDRVKKVHKPSKRTTEDALRKRVGTHFWLISNALTELCQ